MNRGDKELLELWLSGATLDIISEELKKTATSLAHKLVRLGKFPDRASVNSENERRGGSVSARMEFDGFYSIYLVRDPRSNAPIYVGISQNFDKREKNHIHRFTKSLGDVTPIIEVLETVLTYAKARSLERSYIAKFTADGYSLENVLDREDCIQ